MKRFWLWCGLVDHFLSSGSEKLCLSSSRVTICPCSKLWPLHHKSLLWCLSWSLLLLNGELQLLRYRMKAEIPGFHSALSYIMGLGEELKFLSKSSFWVLVTLTYTLCAIRK